MNVTEVVALLSSKGCEPRRARGSWTAKCPAHTDEKPSLSVSSGKDGRVLMLCRAHCATERVLDVLGLKMTDLFPAAPAARPRAPSGSGERCYEVRDVAGALRAVHVRTDEVTGAKRFRWERPDGTSGLAGVPARSLPLYGSERLAAAPAGSTVVLTEGERKADELTRAGVVAVGTVTGASGTPEDEVLGCLRGFVVALWPDADDPGRKHMERIATALRRLDVVARRVEWADAPIGGDAADVLAQPGGADIARRLIASASDWAGPPAAKRRRTPVLVRMADVTSTKVAWLWEPYVPLGKLTLLEGDPGLGKTWLALVLAAAVTRGTPVLPDGAASGPAGILYLTGEDGLADTLKPRLEAAEADVGLVTVLDSVRTETGGEASIELGDVAILGEALAETRASLVVVDPLQAFLGAGVDMNKANETRPVLRGLARLAEQHGCAVLVVRHVRKSASPRAIGLGLGSTDIAGAARSVLLVGADPRQAGRRIMAHSKASLTRAGDSLAFELRDGRFLWLGTSSLRAEDLYGDEQHGRARGPAEAEEFLLSALAGGGLPVETARQLAAGAGISRSALDRARTRLGIRPERVGGFAGAGHWEYQLPDPPAVSASSN